MITYKTYLTHIESAKKDEEKEFVILGVVDDEIKEQLEADGYSISIEEEPYFKTIIRW